MTISQTLARRLALMRQHLAGPRLPPDSSGIMAVMRDLGYMQLDPMRVVAPSHLLTLWSRLGQYDPTHLDVLMWKERRLFQDWAQGSSIVLTEDYPIFSALKRSFATGNSPRAQKIRNWIKKNKRLRGYILSQFRSKGRPLPSHYFEDKSVEDWRSTGWSAGRNVGMMLTILWAQGKIMIAGRNNHEKLWDLTERFLPEWASQERLSDREVFRSIAQKSLRALGVARSIHIKQNYIRGCILDLDDVLAELETEDRIMKVEIKEEDKQARRGPWYIHADNLPLLDRLTADDWEPRTTLLSPFDNLICDRRRTEELFNFHFRFEVYVPKHKRQYGCYVMPILHEDRFIGRIDPTMDRARGRLIINAVYAEHDAPMTKETGRMIADSVEQLGAFLKAKEIMYNQHLPAGWKSALR